MSNLFGFPQGLSGGSKETTYNTSSTTSAPTNYSTSWNSFLNNTSWTTSYNTGQPTQWATSYNTGHNTLKVATPPSWTSNRYHCDFFINLRVSFTKDTKKLVTTKQEVMFRDQWNNGFHVESQVWTGGGNLDMSTFLNSTTDVPYYGNNTPNWFNRIWFAKKFVERILNNQFGSLIADGIIPNPNGANIKTHNLSTGFMDMDFRPLPTTVWSQGGALNSGFSATINGESHKFHTWPLDNSQGITKWYQLKYLRDFVSPVLDHAVKNFWQTRNGGTYDTNLSNIFFQYITPDQYDYVGWNQNAYQYPTNTQSCPISPAFYIYHPSAGQEFFFPGNAGYGGNSSNDGYFFNYLRVSSPQTNQYECHIQFKQMAYNYYNAASTAGGYRQTSWSTSRNTSKTTYWGTSHTTTIPTYISTSQGTGHSTSYTTTYPTSHITYG